MSEPHRYDRHLARRPQSVVVQPTSFCNLDCTYCYLPHRDRREHMAVEVADAVARSVTELAPALSPGRPLELVWHAGEPLALGLRRFGELLAPFEPLRQAGLVHHYVQTNATLVSDDWCRFLARYQFRVGVSIDGPAALNAQRVDRKGKPAFDRIVKGVARLREAGIAFSVIAVVTAESVDRPEDLLDFLAGLGCHTIGINIEETEGVNTTRPMPTVEQARQFWRRTMAWSRRTPGPKVRELARLGDYLHAARTARQTDRGALLIDPIPTVSAAGDVVLLSPELAGIAAPAYDDFRAGNVLHQSLASILDGAHRLRYVDEFLTGLERCEATCQFFDFCRGAQAGNRYFENGRLDTTETNYCRVSRQALITALSDTVREEQAA
ncbi:cyclophane-forming radical SAM peptide maturase AmcB [Kitasatospora sp. LaBMicrA B282]|uniref:cyclophane-forming radical SAM peptide maturase AmcB n=1 Tax=Kitasatospora sp. LaBMicrA B282 TaxID=3420949 RepID=UPI003D151288